MQTRITDQETVLDCLRTALCSQRVSMACYEKQSEAITYETIRALDDLFCRDLMEPSRPVGKTEQLSRTISTWGVNHALRRVVPRTLATNPFHDFESKNPHQSQTDNFLLQCGILGLSERYEGWLQEGILKGELNHYSNHPRIKTVLVLRNSAPSSFDEQIGRIGLRWMSETQRKHDQETETGLENRHKILEPELGRRVKLVDGWRVIYSPSHEIDAYFKEWSDLYLKRIFSQDMIGQDDKIGGRKFSNYVKVLSAISSVSQKNIAFAAILRSRHPTVHIRNLLTKHTNRESFIGDIARFLGAEIGEIRSIIQSFTLSSDNLDVHTETGETSWAPIVQTSFNTLILPTFGIDINPFLFLLTDLRFRHERDWFRIANNREGRWLDELEEMFAQPRWQIHRKNLKLRHDGKILTDIDFATYEKSSNELALFQLKWQHPVGIDNRGRRSSGKNLLDESNRWISSLLFWIEQNGADELMSRLGFKGSKAPTIHLFVLGRYHVHLSGYDRRNKRATWSDWSHFKKAYETHSPLTINIQQLEHGLDSVIEQSRKAKQGESMMFPLGELSVVLNPTSVPTDPQRK